MGIPRSQVEHLIGKQIHTKPKPTILKPKYRSDADRREALKLTAQKAAGEILGWWYERVKFQVGIGANGRPRYYTPDFMVVKSAWDHWQNVWWQIEFREVKGWHRGRERGIARFEAARILYPMFKWTLVEAK